MLYQVLVFLAGFITPKVMLTYYSSEINGLVTSITQFITYFNLVEAGLSGAAIYALYSPIAKKDYEEISSVVTAAKKFYFQAGEIFFALVSIFAVVYPFVVNVTGLSKIEIGVLVLILGMNSVLELFSLAKYRAILSADQKTYIISIASSIQIIVNTIIIYVLARFGVSVIALRGIALLSVFTRTLILLLYVRKKYPYINYKAKPKVKAMDKRWDAVYMQVLGAIHVGSPVVILTFVVKDLLLVSVFSVYNMIITGLHGIMSIFSTGLSASFGDVIVRGENKILQTSYKQFEVAYLSLMTIVYSVAFVMIMPFIKVYTRGITDTNYYLPLVGILVVINGFLYNLKSSQAMLLIAGGLYKESRLQTTIQGLIMVVLGCLFGYFWKIEGIMVGCIISNLYRDIDLLFFIPKHVTHLPVWDSLKRWIQMVFCAAIIIGIGMLLPINADGYITWAAWSLLVFAIGCAVVFANAYIFNREELKGLFERARFLFSKRNKTNV